MLDAQKAKGRHNRPLALILQAPAALTGRLGFKPFSVLFSAT